MGFHLTFFKPGQTIFTKGDSSDCAYIIDRGSVEILNADNSVIQVLKAGELFGEMGVLDQSVRSTAARAVTQVTLLEIKPQQITDRLQQTDPIIHALIGVLLKRLRTMLPEESNNQQHDLLTHVASLIEQNGLAKFRLESELRTAINEQKIETVFQPLMNLSNNKISGFEALSRWSHPRHGIMSPFEFITLAEETDMILEVGSLVFDRAIKLLAELPESIFISINVSGKQLNHPNFLKQLLQRLSEKNIQAERLKLELTETLVVNSQQAATWIKQCQQAGFKVCADDFGTGHSSLLQLLELPFDVLKIDQVFIRELLTNERHQVIVDSMARLAKQLNMKLVAEGVEEVEQHQYLQSLGIDYGQGYYYGKAMRESEILSQYSHLFAD